MIEILMTDDHTIFRSGLRRLLSDEPDIRIVAEASSGAEALERLRERLFSLVLLDVNMGGRNGFETLRKIRASWPKLPVLMLSMYPEEQYAAIAIEAGANGYLSKDRDALTLVAAIRIAASGGFYLPAGMAPQQLMKTHLPNTPPHEQLTEREWDTLRLIVQGVSLTEIGNRLCLSVKTISTYRTRILKKLNLHSNAELVRYCVEHALAE